MDIITYALSRKYTKDSVIGLGAIKGASCTIQSIVDNADGTHDITFAWKDTLDATHTSVLTVSNGETPTIQSTAITGGHRVTFSTTNPAQSVSFDVIDGVDGISVTNAEIDDETNHLIITLSNGSEIDAGEVKGATVLDELEDVEITTAQDKDVLRYDATSGKWINHELEVELDLADLQDLDIDGTTLADGDILKYNATSGKWENEELHIAVNLEDLGNVTISNPLTDGAILKYDGVNKCWVNGTIPNIQSLNDIEDVIITNPQASQVLRYDDVLGAWINSNGGGGGGEYIAGDGINIDENNVISTEEVIFVGTRSAWNALTPAQQSKYDLANIIDEGKVIDISKYLEKTTSMPTASAEYLGQQRLYVGGTDVYVKGTIYECNPVAGSDPTEYQWVAISTAELPIATTQSVGVVKPDGTTITVDLDGTIHAELPEDEFIGTMQAWEALTEEEQNQYTIVNITGDQQQINFGMYLKKISLVANDAGDFPGEIVMSIANEDEYISGYFYRSMPRVVQGEIEYYWQQVDIQPVFDDYDELSHIPTLNSVQISGNKTAEQYNLQNKVQYNNLSTLVASEHKNEIVQYIGATSANYIQGCFYISTPTVESGSVVWKWEVISVQPASSGDYEQLSNLPTINGVQIIGNKSGADLSLQNQIQYVALPTPNNDLLGKVYQYIGADDAVANLKHNYWYQCEYDALTTSYKWINVDVSGSSELNNRVTQLETNQGDMTQLTITGVSDLVSALNQLNLHSVQTIYFDPLTKKLIITYKDSTVFEFDVSSIFSKTDIGELQNVSDSNIQNGNLLQYDTAISKYKPYDIGTTLGSLLQQAKDYTDQEIATVSQADALVVDAKPSYDSGTGVVVYYQNGTMHTTMNAETRFYYTDSVSGDSFCTSWIEGVEFTFNVAQVDYDDFVSKTNDIVSTYTTDMLDKTKVPNVAALDALYTLVSTALGLKVNTADIVDALNSGATNVPLSANQGRVLNEAIATKQDILQYGYDQQHPFPTASATNEGKIYQYVGTTDLSFTNGRFYKCVSDGEATPTYSWAEVKFASDYDATIIEHSTNAPQGGAVYDALATKQNQTLSAPVVVEGTSKTTVEDALNGLNTAKAKKFQYASYLDIPNAAAAIEGLTIQYIGATDAEHHWNEGSFYKCEEVTPTTTPATYHWVELTQQIEFDTALSNTSHNGVENQAVTNALQALQEGVIVEYTNEASRPNAINYAGGEILAIGTICHCNAEKTWYKVTAIDSSTLVITWTAYNPHIASDAVATSSTVGLMSAGDGLSVDANGEVKVVDRLKETNSLPTAASTNVGECYLLTQAQSGYVKGGTYQCQLVPESDPAEYHWVLISSADLKGGTGITVTGDIISLDSTTQGILNGLGTASTRDVTTNISPNNHGLVESGIIYSAINTALNTIYTPRGSVACADLTAALLVPANVGNVYETTDSGTTTALFMQGADKPIAKGDSIGVVQTGASEYKFNLMGNTLDLTNYKTIYEAADLNDWNSLSADEKAKYDYFTTPDESENYPLHVKQVRLYAGTAYTEESSTYGGWHVGGIQNFYTKCELSESVHTIINVVANNNSGSTAIPIFIRDCSASNYVPYHAVAFCTSETGMFNTTNGYVEFKVFYVDKVLTS